MRAPAPSLAALAALLACVAPRALAGASPSPAASPRPRYISAGEAKPLLDALASTVPDGLKAPSARGLSEGWTGWIRGQDRVVRARLAQGDLDSLANFLVFGTSFTKAPRVTPAWMLVLEERDRREGTARAVGEITAALDARADDLVATLSRPSGDERLEFFRRLVESKGFRLTDPADQPRLGVYLATNLQRVRDEYQAFARELAAARGSPARELDVRSRLFRTRGIALDASLLPNLAVEEALRGLEDEGVLAPASVHRVAVVGPGLDFIDKQEGYDFYPPQTIQPFAVVDSLRRLGLAARGGVEVTALDISGRVNDHIARAAARARHGAGYLVRLPRPAGVRWTAEADGYWRRFGDRIGDVVPAPAPPGLEEVELRAVRVRPEVVRRVAPVDLNVVYQRLDLRPEGRFDVVVATNVLVYYDTFEQGLASANIGAMLRPGGVLLCNNALPDLPVSGLRSAGRRTVRYSDRPDDGDHVMVYRRATRRSTRRAGRTSSIP